MDENKLTGMMIISWIDISCYLRGLQSESKEQIERRTLDIVNAGLQFSFSISKQMLPLLLTLQ